MTVLYWSLNQQYLINKHNSNEALNTGKYGGQVYVDMNHILWQPSSRGLPHIELEKTIILFRKVNVSDFRICNFRSQNVMSLLKIDLEIIIQTILNDPIYLQISEMDQNWIKQKLFKSVDVVPSKDLSDSEMNFQIFIYFFSIIQV